MIANKMKPYLQNNSAIRAMYEEGKKMAAVYGADQVYDFSLGNPNVPAPAQIKDDEAKWDVIPTKISMDEILSVDMTPQDFSMIEKERNK